METDSVKDSIQNMILDFYSPRPHTTIDVDVKSLERAIAEQLTKYWGGYVESRRSSDSSTIELRGLLKNAIQRIQTPEFETADVLLVVLDDCALVNGHAFVKNGIGIAFYVLKDGYSIAFHRVFAMHEIIHAIHYKLNSTFAFDTSEWQQQTSRQLLCEGIATVFTAIALRISMKEALWSDALSHATVDGWMLACESSKGELCQQVLDNFDLNATSGLFQFVPEAVPIANRSGYWLGSLFIYDLLDKGWSAQEILLAPYSVLSEQLRGWLLGNAD